jgi:hypothetical protein
MVLTSYKNGVRRFSIQVLPVGLLIGILDMPGEKPGVEQRRGETFGGNFMP